MTIAPLDPAILDDCPVEVASPGELPPLDVVETDEGRFVPLQMVVERDRVVLEGLLAYRGAYRACRSVIEYVEEREAGLE